MTKESIRGKVERRVAEYSDPVKRQWFTDWFEPTLEHILLKCISWEDLVAFVRSSDRQFGDELADFYARCLEFNRLQERDES